MIPLTENENKYYEEQEKCYICQKEFCYDKNKKSRFRRADHSIYNLNYKVPQ